jgi:hypothetical protein
MDAQILLPDVIRGLFLSSNLAGRFWLYWFSTFADLLITLLSMTIFYLTAKNFHPKRDGAYGRWSSPLNIAKISSMCMMTFVWCRVSIDTLILLTWQEVSPDMTTLFQQLNELFDAIALAPFLAFFYILLRAGPLIEFQLIRQPIPSDLHPSWKMIRGPVFAFGIMVILSLLVVSTKLFR